MTDLRNESPIEKVAWSPGWLFGATLPWTLHWLDNENQIDMVTGVSGSGKSTLVQRILYPAVKRHLDSYGDKPGFFKRVFSRKNANQDRPPQASNELNKRRISILRSRRGSGSGTSMRRAGQVGGPPTRTRGGTWPASPSRSKGSSRSMSV